MLSMFETHVQHLIRVVPRGGSTVDLAFYFVLGFGSISLISRFNQSAILQK